MMASQAVRKKRPGTDPALVISDASVRAATATPLDPLIAVLARAAEQSGPAQPPDPHQTASG
ncbi:MAG: hypothetical protein V4583_10255 [Pseudomonadota bacterium]